MGIENRTLFDIAMAELKTSELILETSNDELMQNIAAYHTQQAIEKVINYLLIEKQGYGSPVHDLGLLVADAKSLKINIPEWVDQNSYEISRWATTIRYNSSFKSNRDSVSEFNA